VQHYKQNRQNWRCSTFRFNYSKENTMMLNPKAWQDCHCYAKSDALRSTITQKESCIGTTIIVPFLCRWTKVNSPHATSFAWYSSQPSRLFLITLNSLHSKRKMTTYYYYKKIGTSQASYNDQKCHHRLLPPCHGAILPILCSVKLTASNSWCRSSR